MSQLVHIIPAPTSAQPQPVPVLFVDPNARLITIVELERAADAIIQSLVERLAALQATQDALLASATYVLQIADARALTQCHCNNPLTAALELLRDAIINA